MMKFDESVFENILKGLGKYDGFYSRDYYLELEERINSMKKRIQDSQSESRILKIGVVGEVKAGKSSFLNALIFNGEDILPKACTPMTAALTKISYGEKQAASIYFYSEQAWEKIENYSQQYDEMFESEYEVYKKKVDATNALRRNMKAILLSREEKKNDIDKKLPKWLVACKELTDMASKSTIDRDEVLGTCKELEVADIKTGLKDYIGAGGKFTALVEHVEIKMNNEIFKEVEIVDTPGLNDPIISRGEKTKQFLCECDVVFLLSYSGQFFTQEDISFISKTLPREGIRNVVVVGSKFDSGLLDDNKSKSIAQARAKFKTDLDIRARENIKECLKNSYKSDVMERIERSLPPSYVSSVLYSCAKKVKENVKYDAFEQNIINQLKMHFSDFKETYEILMSLSGIDEIKRKRIKKILEGKNKIINERNAMVVEDSKTAVLDILENINIQALQNKENIQNTDKEALEKKAIIIKEKMNDVRKNIHNQFKISSAELVNSIKKMEVEVVEEINNHQYLEISSSRKTVRETVKTGLFGWKRENYTYEVITHSASVSDAISNLRNFTNTCHRFLNDQFDHAINTNGLQDKIKDIVIGAFDLSDSNFNENDILIPLEIVMKQMKMPKININNGKFEQDIIDDFEATVNNEAINQLKLAQNQAMQNVANEIKTELENNIIDINNMFSTEAAMFVDNILSKLSSNLENVSKLIDDKENSIKKYDELNKLIITYKKSICEMEN